MIVEDIGSFGDNAIDYNLLTGIQTDEWIYVRVTFLAKENRELESFLVRNKDPIQADERVMTEQ